MLGFRRLVSLSPMDLLPSPEVGREVGPSFGLSALAASSPLFELVVGSMRCMAGRKLFVRRNKAAESLPRSSRVT